MKRFKKLLSWVLVFSAGMAAVVWFQVFGIFPIPYEMPDYIPLMTLENINDIPDVELNPVYALPMLAYPGVVLTLLGFAYVIRTEDN